ncbi:MAG: hypothetical protein WBA72_05600 [Ornithinimicrobium sp.]
MSPEGPKDSPEVNEPTTVSAVQPLPPGSNAEEVVDAIDKRIQESWKEMEADDDTETRGSHGPGDPHETETESNGETEDEPTA